MSPIFSRTQSTPLMNHKRSGKRSWTMRSIVKSTIAGSLSLYGLVQSAPKAKAQPAATYTWSGTAATTDLWSNSTRWVGGVGPTAPGNSTVVLLFNGNTGAQVAQNDLGNYTLQALTFGGNQTQTITTVAGVGNQLYFDNANATINIANTGTKSILSNITFSAATANFTILRTAAASASLTIGNATTFIDGANTNFIAANNTATTIAAGLGISFLSVQQGAANANIITANATTFSTNMTVGAGGIQVSNGTLTLNGNTTVAGAVVVTNGVLVNANATTIFSGGFQAVGGTSNFTVNSVQSAAVTGGFFIGGTGNITGLGGAVGNAGTAAIVGLRGNNSLGTALQTVNLNNGTLNLGNQAAAQDFNFGLSVGAGTTTLNAAVPVGTGIPIRSVSNITMAPAASLTTGISNVTAASGVAYLLSTPTTALNGNATFTVNGGTFANLANQAVGQVNVGGILSLGAVTDNATSRVTKAGNGTLIQGSGIPTLGYQINAGTVVFNDPAALSFLGVGGNVTIAIGGAIGVDGGNANIASLLAAGTSKIIANATGSTFALSTAQAANDVNFSTNGFSTMFLGAQMGNSVTYAGTYTPGTAGQIRLGGGGGNLAYAVNITGSDSVVIGGSANRYQSGYVTLAGTNSYTGNTTLEGGILRIFSTGELGSTGNLVFNGGVLDAAIAGSYTLPSTRVLAASTLIFGGPSLACTTASNITFANLSIGSTLTAVPQFGNIANTAGVTFNFTDIRLTATSTLSLSRGNVANGTAIIGNISIANATAQSLTLTGVGGVDFKLAGTNTYIGTLTTGGTGTTAVTNPLSLSSNIALNVSSATNLFSLNGNSITIGNLAGLTGSILNNSSTAATITVAQVATVTTGNTANGGNLSDGTGGGALSFVKAGAAASNISVIGNFSYTGATLIASGGVQLARNAGTNAPGVLSQTSSIQISGPTALLLLGDTGSAANNIVSNRLNQNTNLTLGGFGGGSLLLGLGNNTTLGPITVNQSINGNTVFFFGASSIAPNAATGSDANVTTNLLLNGCLSRSPGSTLTIGTNAQFNIITGANANLAGNAIYEGGPTNRLLIGAAAGGTNFVTVTGNGTALANASYSAAFTAGSNTDVTANLTATTASTDSIRFNSPAITGPLNVTFFTNGNNTINSGMILATTGATGANAITLGNAASYLRGSAADLIVVTNRGAGNDLVIASNITNSDGNSSALTKGGTGNLILSSTNSNYTGGTFINAGVLRIASIANGGANSSIGSSSSAASNLMITNGTLRIQAATAGAQSTDRLFTITAEGTNSIQANSPNTGNALSFTNTGNVAFIGLGNRTLTLDGTNTDNNTFAPGIQDATEFTSNGTGGSFLSPSIVPQITTLAKAGSGLWVLTNTNNSYSGNTNLAAGNLAFSNESVLGTSNIINSTGGGIRFDSSGLTLAGKTVFLNGAFTINTNNNNFTISPTFGGTNTFTKTGAGNLTVNSNITSTGNISVNQGRLIFGGTILPTVTLAVSGNGSVMDFNNLSFTANQLLVSGGNITNAGTTLAFGNAVTFGSTTAQPFASTVNNLLAGGTLRTFTNTTLTTTGNIGAGSLVVGSSVAPTGVAQANGVLTMGVGSTLQVGNGAAAQLLRIGDGSTGNGTTQNRGILDAQNASNVTINVGNISLGFPSTANETYGRFILPRTPGATSNLTSPFISIGGSNSTGPGMTSSPFGTGNFGSLLDLGNQSVTITTTLLRVGNAKSSGTVRFNGTGGTLAFTGDGTATLEIGNNAITATGTSPTGLFDGTGGTVTGNLAAIVIGRSNTNNAAGGANGTLILNGSSAVTAGFVVIGDKIDAANTGITFGNLSLVGNSSLTVTGSITTGGLGSGNTVGVYQNRINVLENATLNAQGGIAFGLGNSTFTVSGGSVALGGNVTVNAAGNSAFALSGGIFDANDKDIGSFTRATSPFAFTGGTLQDAGNIAQTGGITNAGGTFTRVSPGTTTVNGVYTMSSGLTTISDGNLAVTGNYVQNAGITTIGSAGNAAIGGNLSINGGHLHVNGTATVSGGVTTVGSGATLLGTGTLTSVDVNIATGGILAPGASIGTITVGGNISFGNNSNFNAELGFGNTSDRVLVTGGATSFLNFTAGANFNPSGIGVPEQQFVPASYIVASVGTGLGASNILVNGAVPGSPNLGSYTIGGSSSGPVDIDPSLLSLQDGSTLSLDIVGDNVVLTVTATPEPMTITLFGAMGLGAVGFIRRRRNKSAVTSS